MRRSLRRSVLAPTAALLALACAPAASAVAGGVTDPVPIRPHQFFTGLVNGHRHGHVVIRVNCPGPADKTGHPVGHQAVEVEPRVPGSAADLGYTGRAGNRIRAELRSPAGQTAIARFSSYFVRKFIPTSITAPCSGGGTVRFVPAPHSRTARAAVLRVTFENIGA